MKFVLFYHSFVSCWNHGNAHFLRGVVRELIALGHRVTVYEPSDGWSRANALRDDGGKALAEVARLVAGVDLRVYDAAGSDVERAVDDANVVIVHEWNEPRLVSRLGQRRRENGRFLLMFHDTHHRGVTAPKEIDRLDLDGYDAVLAFGEVLREVYLRRGWGRRVFTWHEAADTALFRPLLHPRKSRDLIWIGNWGDGERSEELHQFLIDPIAELGLNARIHGVRYPEAIRDHLSALGISYGGWLPNHRVPEAFSEARATVHVPRRPYVDALPGIPTIRVFEALASGIPLVSAPWSDVEGLFPSGSYMTARNGMEMTAALRLLLADSELAGHLVRTGLDAIEARHTCRHRVEELMIIVAQLTGTDRVNEARDSGVAREEAA